MLKNKKIGLGIILGLLVAAIFVGVWVNQPAYAFTVDVNPSIEIVSNRLDRVVAVNPKNEDAKELLKDYKFVDKDLKNTVEDLADLMVLKGYISGGKDNLVMITVSDNEVNQDAVDRLNNVIAAYLENKQIEATIINQSISEEYNNTGKELVAKRISDLDDDLDFEVLSNMTLKELVELADANNIAPEKLFSRILGNNVTKEDNHLDKKEADLAKKDDHLDNKQDSKQEDIANKENHEMIGIDRAKEIALDLVGGQGKIVKFKLDSDDDDPEYEIEIIANGYEYEIEIDAYTGKVLEFEKDD